MSENDIANENAVIATTKVNEIITQEYIDMITQFEELEAKIKVKKAEIDNALLNAMIETNTWEIENNKFKVVRVEPGTKTVVDTQKMKNEGIYEFYTKKTSVKPYIKFKLKYEED